MGDQLRQFSKVLDRPDLDLIVDFDRLSDVIDFQALDIEYNDLIFSEIGETTDISSEGTDFVIRVLGALGDLSESDFFSKSLGRAATTPSDLKAFQA